MSEFDVKFNFGIHCILNSWIALQAAVQNKTSDGNDELRLGNLLNDIIDNFNKGGFDINFYLIKNFIRLESR
jgi:hypothetical protein